ncbi:ATP-grasp domain-containing protein [Desulfitibacter alkalitolerans]|uniref:ATP-grasp domain-containing protein n=1 Tax=Desulfitibacter alkalitolerans TaxID=264641 RepID=UPI0004836A0D|nr:ATP-grasp domain-containing protein [Desulfitibacter alkalitolerans]
MARILEHYALNILKENGLPVVDFSVASSGEDAEKITEEMQKPVVVKALIPIGKRGKAGAVKSASGAKEAFDVADEIIGKSVRGYPVHKVIVAEEIKHTAQIYVSISIHPGNAQPVIVFSLSGGVDIEDVAENSPESIITYYVNPLDSLALYHCIDIIAKAGLIGEKLVKAANLLRKIYEVFVKYDATLIEINPLFLTPEDEFVIPTCMFSIDDAAMFRHLDLKEIALEGSERTWKPLTEIERKVQEFQDKDPYRGTARYTELEDGDIGFMCGGGGGSLVLFDELLAAGGKSANYTEFGGNPPEDKVYGLAKCILSKPGVRGLFVAHNITNNTQVDVEARGIVRAIKEMGIDSRVFPIVTRMPGINEEEGFRILREAGIESYGEELTMAGSAKRMVEKMKELNQGR